MNTPHCPLPPDWRDRLAGDRVDPPTIASWLRAAAADPEVLADLEMELALNGLLAATAAPAVASNFARRVVDGIRTGDAPRPTGVLSAAGWLRRGWHWLGPAFAVLVLAGGLGAWRWQDRAEARGARAAAELTGMATAGGVPPTALADFDAVRRLNAVARPEDEELVIALLQ